MYDMQADTKYEIHQKFPHSRDLASQSAVPGAAFPPLAAIWALHRDTDAQAQISIRSNFNIDHFLIDILHISIQIIGFRLNFS